MSRTIRRKFAHHQITLEWDTYSKYSKNWYRRRYPGKTDEQILKSIENKFHCDNHPGEWSAPSAYGKYLNKKIKKRNEEALTHCLKYNEEFIEHPFKRDSGWNYF